MKLSDFKRAVNTIVLSVTSDLHIPIREADLPEPIVRPSIKTFVDVGSSSRLNADILSRTVHTDIYFFAADKHRPRMENMDMIDRLSYAFLNGIDVDEALHIPLLENIEFSVEDGVLHAEFDVDVYERIDPDIDVDPMENLTVTVDIGKPTMDPNDENMGKFTFEITKEA